MMRPFHFPFISLCLALFLTNGSSSVANNIQVHNVTVAELDMDQGTARIRFDVSWENSWRGALGTDRDAAWLFIKHRNNSGVWGHARLASTGHTAPSGAVLEIGLVNTEASHDPTTNPVAGILIYRSAQGSGTFNATGVELVWTFGQQSIDFSALTDIRVFAYEMVLVPEGAFAAGSGGSETNAFTLTTINTAIASTPPSGTGILGGQAGGYPTGQVAPNASWPNGFRAFYCMKYEVSQQQYVDFLNTLTRAQQNTLFYNNFPPGVTSTTNRYVLTATASPSQRNGVACSATFDGTAPLVLFCDLNGNGVGGDVNDGLWLPCGSIQWTQMGMFLSWSGLRPMSELEYEKACRGGRTPLANEYPWGTTTIATTGTPMTDAGTTNEGVVNYSLTAGNAVRASGSVRRVGSLSANPLNSGKVSAGASEFGIMEMAGNLAEVIVHLHTIQGRNYTGRHGSGTIGVVSGWPSFGDHVGSALRGGSFSDVTDGPLRISDRTQAFDPLTLAFWYNGMRGVRTAP